MKIITLTTDLGLKDHYVASLKGNILRQFPDCQIIDISHQITKYSIPEAAFVFKNAYKEFPEGTIHILGVKPEADKQVKHIAIEHNNHFFIGADNGQFSIILDGATIVHMLRPRPGIKTFKDYATQVFLPYLQSQQAARVDIVWDVYLPDSLKAFTRSTRGKGVRRRVEQSSSIPQNWSEFLRIDENKMELFAFLATSVASMETDKQIISTHHADVLCTKPRDLSGIARCNHEEADTRIMLHVDDAVKHGHTKVSIRTVDTDVVVLAVTSAQRLDIPELWVAFGTGNNYRFLAAHEMARVLGPDRCRALPMFHAFTGCDTVSFFGGRGKKTAWETWQRYNEVTAAFCALGDEPDTTCVEEHFQSLQRYVILLYDRTSSQDCINATRKQLFTQKGRAIDGLPPTKAALIQHVKRAAYQAGHCWGQMMSVQATLPSPSEWGWNRGDGCGWNICWTTLPEATNVCRELLRCGCKKGCRGECKCTKDRMSKY